MRFRVRTCAEKSSIVPSAGTNQIRFNGSACASQPYGHPNVWGVYSRVGGWGQWGLVSDYIRKVIHLYSFIEYVPLYAWYSKITVKAQDMDEEGVNENEKGLFQNSAEFIGDLINDPTGVPLPPVIKKISLRRLVP